MNECDSILASLAGGSEADLHKTYLIMYDPQKPYSKSAFKTWKGFAKNPQVAFLYPDWRDLFWEAFEKFCQKATSKEAPGDALQKTSQKTPSPIQDCAAYFNTICVNLCRKASARKKEEETDEEEGFLENLREPLPETDTEYDEWERYRQLLKKAIQQLGYTCKKLIIAKFYDGIDDPEQLSELVERKVAPSSMAAKITNCKANLRKIIAGFEPDSFKEN